MKMTIFYFTGTGNSLDAAKRIVGSLGYGEIKPIAEYRARASVDIDDDIIGIVYPVYSQTIPGNVKEFIRKMVFKTAPYIFSVATNNGGPGRANFDVARLLKRKGQVLRSGFIVQMPGNSIIIKDFTNSLEEQRRRLSDMGPKIEEIASHIKRCANNKIEGDTGIKWYIEGKITTLARIMYNLPSRFLADPKKCSKCAVCVRICPENNIKLDQSIRFGSTCSNCLGCYHWCPNNAITIRNKEYGQYRNPNVLVKELFLR